MNIKIIEKLENLLKECDNYNIEIWMDNEVTLTLSKEKKKEDKNIKNWFYRRLK